MQKVRSLVFRKLTDADFFNINKPAGTEHGGGGQSYIDFTTSSVTISNWRDFFKGVRETKGTNGPWWKFDVRSLGTTKGKQRVTIAQRRAASVILDHRSFVVHRPSESMLGDQISLTSRNPRTRSYVVTSTIFTFTS